MRVTFSLRVVGMERYMAEDPSGVDFFRDPRLVDNPYPFFEGLRSECPVAREEHYGVTMVTGWEEAVQVYNDAENRDDVLTELEGAAR